MVDRSSFMLHVLKIHSFLIEISMHINVYFSHRNINCKVAQTMWTSVLGWFKYSGALSHSLQHLFQAWKMIMGSARGKIMWIYIYILQSYGFSRKKRIQGVVKESLLID